MAYGDSIELKELLGKTLAKVTGEVDGDRMTFEADTGEKFALFHCGDCCERVTIQDINGDLSDLIGSPITMADESTNSDSHPEGVEHEYEPESFTWTFYKLATIKGFVDIRWLGTSNGYYSERVSFERVSN